MGTHPDLDGGDMSIKVGGEVTVEVRDDDLSAEPGRLVLEVIRDAVDSATKHSGRSVAVVTVGFEVTT